jgi:beta-glucosidase
LGFDVTAQYPFGFGMSYTTYEYSNFRLEKSAMGKDESIKAYVDIRNTGSREGDEIAQLYICDDYASVTRPVKELKDFKRVNLKPGEQKTVAFDITPEKLAFYDANMKWIVEPGDFTVMVGPSSADVKSLKLTVE